MFDIGFFELAVVAVVALFVVGPERLPGLVRTAGFWFGKIRYWINSTKMEMKSEWHNAEILRQEAESKAKGAIEEQLTINTSSNEKEKGSESPPSKPL